MSKLGPRIIFKTDAESSIGRGAVTYGAHFRPEISKIIWAASVAARKTSAAIRTVVVTEGHRDTRKGRDLHKELRALDFTFRLGGNARPIKAGYQKIALEMRKLLGPDYDIVVHRVGSDAIHVHAELDPQ